MAERDERLPLRDEKGNEIEVFTGKPPTRAALKAANRGHTDIRLPERGRGMKMGARVHGQAGAGGQAQGRAGLDGRQDLEAAGQEGGRREAGIALKASLR